MTLTHSFGYFPAFSTNKTQTEIALNRIETPLGTMFAAAVEEGICLLEFDDRKMLTKQFELLSKQLGATIVEREHRHFKLLKEELASYFSGTLTQFTVPISLIGTPFQQKVWHVLQTIPYSKTCSYKEQAIAINQPTAVRAVANANGKNKIAIIIPCHRVIGADGSLTGYAGGLERKQQLLALERGF